MARLTRHEKPLRGKKKSGNNPNRITVNQHVLPRRHILEWSRDGKAVEVFDLDSNKSKILPAENPYFCVMRLWDQWTEEKMLKPSEDNYQAQMSLMKRGESFDNAEHIMAYYVLLCVRTWVASNGRPQHPSLFSSISHESDQLELEDNEKEMDGPVHFVISTIDPNSQHHARQVVKMAMNQAFIQWCERIKMCSWVVYQSDGEDFILPDSFHVNFQHGLHVLPVSPKKALIADSTYEELEKTNSLNVHYINGAMKGNSVIYYIQAPDSDVTLA